MQKRAHPSFGVMELFRQEPEGLSVTTYPKDQIFYAQGDAANSVFYINKGKVKVTVFLSLARKPLSQSGGRTNSAARVR